MFVTHTMQRTTLEARGDGNHKKNYIQPLIDFTMI
jgi:hypothetical protein